MTYPNSQTPSSSLVKRAATDPSHHIKMAVVMDVYPFMWCYTVGNPN
jgi:hypothetical protein